LAFCPEEEPIRRLALPGLAAAHFRVRMNMLNPMLEEKRGGE
jgi:hypothetical protein